MNRRHDFISDPRQFSEAVNIRYDYFVVTIAGGASILYAAALIVQYPKVISLHDIAGVKI